MNETIERRHASASERESILHVGICYQIAQEAKAYLWQRAKLVPRLRCWIGMLAWVSQRVLSDLLKTIPGDQLMAIRRCVKDAVYVTGVRGAGKTRHMDEWGTYISFDDLGELLEVVRHEHCALCDIATDPVRCGRCKLRRAMDNVGADVPESTGARCKYWEAAINEQK